MDTALTLESAAYVDDAAAADIEPGSLADAAAYATGKPRNNITRMASGKWRVRVRCAAVDPSRVFAQDTSSATLSEALAKQAKWEKQIAAGELPEELIIPDGAPGVGPNAREVPLPKLTVVAAAARPGRTEPAKFEQYDRRAEQSGNESAINTGMGRARIFKLHAAINEYERASKRAPSDIAALDYVNRLVGDTPLKDVSTPSWATSFIDLLKDEEHNLSPGTIRARCQAIARVIDHHIHSRNDPKAKADPARGPAVVTVNAFRNLPRNYSEYPEDHANPREDQTRWRRLTPKEAAAIDAVFKGAKPAGKERALFEDGEGSQLEIMYRLLVNCGLRLKEAYMLRVDAVDKTLPFVTVVQSKQTKKKPKPPRPVALPDEVHSLLLELAGDRAGDELLFAFWDGKEHPYKAGTRLAGRLRTLIDHAGLTDFTPHDLRHEAACRIVQMRNADGQFTFPDSTIIKMMGWTKPDMLQRYLSLRGEDVAHMIIKSRIPATTTTEG